jgi:fused signal recognition particle receptor
MKLIFKSRKNKDKDKDNKKDNSSNKLGWKKRLRQGLSKTHKHLFQNLDKVFLGQKIISPQLLEEVEELLISTDLGVNTTQQIIDHIQEQLSRKQLKDYASVKAAIRDKLLQILGDNKGGLSLEAASPLVIMMLGVNGVGKTTTIGKLAYRYRQQGKKVMLVAADTFRAAAIEQLQIWGQRVGVEVMGHQTGADPSAVVYDSLAAAQARDMDLLIIDTAGRMHTKKNLMEELKKMKRVAGKCMPGAPHETLLVLDSATGQNAIAQARQFHQDLELSGLVLTKLDGTAKGGVVIGITSELGLPIKLIGVGEDLEDLQDFDSSEFVNALFEEEYDEQD